LAKSLAFGHENSHAAPLRSPRQRLASSTSLSPPGLPALGASARRVPLKSNTRHQKIGLYGCLVYERSYCARKVTAVLRVWRVAVLVPSLVSDKAIIKEGTSQSNECLIPGDQSESMASFPPPFEKFTKPRQVFATPPPSLRYPSSPAASHYTSPTVTGFAAEAARVDFVRNHEP